MSEIVLKVLPTSINQNIVKTQRKPRRTDVKTQKKDKKTRSTKLMNTLASKSGESCFFLFLFCVFTWSLNIPFGLPWFSSCFHIERIRCLYKDSYVKFPSWSLPFVYFCLRNAACLLNSCQTTLLDRRFNWQPLVED